MPHNAEGEVKSFIGVESVLGFATELGPGSLEEQ